MSTQHYEVYLTDKQCIVNGVVIGVDDHREDIELELAVAACRESYSYSGCNYWRPEHQTPLSEVLGKLYLENIWHGEVVPMTPNQKIFAEHNILQALVMLLYSEGDSL